MRRGNEREILIDDCRQCLLMMRLFSGLMNIMCGALLTVNSSRYSSFCHPRAANGDML
jgi:hypothetical protein